MVLYVSRELRLSMYRDGEGEWIKSWSSRG